MARGAESFGKRQRAADKAKKKRMKAERRDRKRERGPKEIPVASLEDVTGDLEAIESATRARRAAAAKNARTIPCRLFVGSLSWGVTEDDLREAFGEFGQVTDAIVVKDRDTGKSRGFGFVVMADHKDASRAIDQMNDAIIDGRPLVANVATERQR